jgi:hypothetical protein
MLYIVDLDGITQMQMTLVLKSSLHLQNNLMFRFGIPFDEKWVSSIWQIRGNPQTFYKVVSSLIGYKLLFVILIW